MAEHDGEGVEKEGDPNHVNREVEVVHDKQAETNIDRAIAAEDEHQARTGVEQEAPVTKDRAPPLLYLALFDLLVNGLTVSDQRDEDQPRDQSTVKLAG